MHPAHLGGQLPGYLLANTLNVFPPALLCFCHRARPTVDNLDPILAVGVRYFTSG